MTRGALVVGVLLAVSPTDLMAQPARMNFLSSSANGIEMAEVDVTPGTVGAVMRRTPVPQEVFGGKGPDVPILLAGGRYMAWINWGRSGADPRTFTLFDRRTGAALGPLGATVATFVVADPVRPRLFVPGGVHAGLPAQITMFDADTGVLTAILPAVPCCEGVVKFAYASAVDQLIAPVVRGFAPTIRAQVVDVATGAVVRDIPWPSEADGFEAIETSADGRRLYVKASNRLLMVDGISGAILARSAPFIGRSAPLVAGSGRNVIVDERAGRVLVPHAGRLMVFDASTLATMADPLIGDPDGTLFAFKGLGPVGAFTVTGCTIDVWDASYITRLSPPAPCQGSVPVLSLVPPAPEALDALVSPGRQVRLSWASPGDAAAYDVLVGMAPGAVDFVVSLGRSTTAVFNAVPPGAYYVRVRGVNENGAGFASREVRVAVP